MADIALVYQPRVTEALPLAQSCAVAVTKRGGTASVISSWELGSGIDAGSYELVLTFGGDGTILRAARWIGDGRTPVVGVQMGRLGFLAELLPADLPGVLDPYLSGDYWADQRSMILTTVDGVNQDAGAAEGGAGLHALNEVVVGRGASPRTVTVDVSVNGSPLHTFRCDGVIVATATGSTAYSFAAGGPVLVPDSTDLVVTPICPHNSTLRSIVLPGDALLRLQVWAAQTSVVSVDGQVDLPIEDGTVVAARRSDRTTTFARRGPRAEFYQRVLAKLH
jgi:NAD+ kinase